MKSLHCTSLLVSLPCHGHAVHDEWPSDQPALSPCRGPLNALIQLSVALPWTTLIHLPYLVSVALPWTTLIHLPCLVSVALPWIVHHSHPPALPARCFPASC